MASGNAVLATANGLPLFEHGKLSGVTGKGGAKAKQVVSLMETTCFTSEDNLFCGGKQVIFRHGNNLFWMRLQTRKVMSTWAMMTLMNMPMG